MADVVVVGGGVGGLSAATTLARRGHAVTVVERRPDVGGKLAVLRRDGFTFDIGPSLLTMPHLLDPAVRDRLDLIRLDPQFRYRWSDGHELLVSDAGVRSDFVTRGGQIWDVSERTFFAGPMSNPLSLIRRMRSPMDLLRIDPLRTLHASARKAFPLEPRMQQWAGRYATYSGSSPYRAPATLACIPAIEARYGCWYPRGGLGRLAEALAAAADDAGVQIRTSTSARSIDVAGGRTCGVTTSDGERLPASIVVANTDAELLYRDLLPHPKALRSVRRADRSTSGFVVVAGVRGTTEGLRHHNVWFPTDARAEFDQIDAGTFASDPTIYGCVSSVTDATQAPAGHENWFLLVNAPPGVAVDSPTYQRLLLDRLAEHGTDIRDRLLFTETITPADLEARYGAPGGSIYGTSSNGRRAAFVRPRNRGAVHGLYLVGGSSHPGGGLPLVTISARIVTDMIEADLGSHRR